jgi:hypothetical protein
MSKQLIVEIDDRMARDLERVAPARSRKRSQFIRTALRRILDEEAEARMAEAYRRQPDVEPVYFDARVWDAHPHRASAGRGRR